MKETTGSLGMQTPAVKDAQTCPHLVVLFTPRLSSVGLCRPLRDPVLRLDRGSMRFGDVIVEDGNVSRKQGQIAQLSGGQHVIIDEGSRNGIGSAAYA